MKAFTKIICSLVLLASMPVLAIAPPAWINFQGRLLDNNGIPVTQNNMAFVVKIWTDPASTLPANLKYSESHTVNVSDGVYSFPVGSGTPISGSYGASLYANNSVLWLEITVQSETLLPRHRLLSAPYTNHSGNSENLGGQGIAYFGTAAADNYLQGQINGLQDQINNLPGGGGLQSLCEATGNIWDGDKCYAGIKAIDYQGKMVPVDQDNVQLALPNGDKECMQKHYRPVEDSRGDPLEVLNCQADPIEAPGQYGCGFGAVSVAITIKLDDCPLMNPKEQEEPPK